MIEKADLLLFNVERLRNAYRERYAHVPARGSCSFRTGSLPVRWRKRPSGEVRALHPVLHRYALCGPLARTGVRGGFAAHSERQGGPEAIRIKLVGQCRMVDGVPTASLIANGLESSGSLRSRSLREAMEIIRRSHLALLLAPPAALSDSRQSLRLSRNRGEDPGHRRRRRHLDLIRDTGSGRAFAPGTSTGSRPSSMKRWPPRGLRPRRRRPVLPGSTQGGSPRNWRATWIGSRGWRLPMRLPPMRVIPDEIRSGEAGTVRFRILEEMVERFAELTGDRSALT